MIYSILENEKKVIAFISRSTFSTTVIHSPWPWPLASHFEYSFEWNVFSISKSNSRLKMYCLWEKKVMITLCPSLCSKIVHPPSVSFWKYFSHLDFTLKYFTLISHWNISHPDFTLKRDFKTWQLLVMSTGSLTRQMYRMSNLVPRDKIYIMFS